VIVSTEAAGFGSGCCLDRLHSTGAAEVKQRSVMMGSSAPLLFRDARGCEPGLIVGQSVADGHQGRPLTLRAALPARETVHIPSNCRSGFFVPHGEGSVCSARRGVRGQEGQRACPLGCQVSFNESVQWACLVQVRARVRARQRRTAEGRERRSDGVQQRSRGADVFVVGERSGCVGSWKFEWGSDSGVGSEQWAGLGLHRRRQQRRKGVGFGSKDNAEADRRDWSIGNNSKPAVSYMQLHTYTSDSAAWITAPLLVFSALNWCDSCESPSLSLSYPTAEELPERHVGCTLAARWLHAAWLPSPLSSLLDAPSAVPAAAVLVVHGPPPCAPST
jgi:hypothetical protein